MTFGQNDLVRTPSFRWQDLYSSTPRAAVGLMSPLLTPRRRVPSQAFQLDAEGEGEGEPAEKALSSRYSATALSEDQHSLSMPEAVFNLTNTVLGVGVLSVPYAFRLSGYVCILLILVVITVTAQTANFIGAALVLASRSPAAAEVPPRGRDFAFLAQVALGDSGRMFIGAVTCLEIWFALVTFIVMNGVNLQLVWPSFGTAPASVLSCLLAAPMVLLPMRISSYLSLGASIALAVASVALVCAALTMDEWANPYDTLGESALLHWENVPRSVGIIVFCFAGHPCFPVVHECMKDKSSWRRSVGVTFFLAFLYYGGLGVFSYLVFGKELEVSVTTNLKFLPRAVLFRKISALAFVVKIQLTAPLLLNAIIVAYWAPEVDAPEWPAKRIIVLLALTAITAWTAVMFSDDVAAVASLTGSLFTMTTSVLFPALAHLRLARRYDQDWQKSDATARWVQALPHYLVLAFGASMALAGTALALQDVFA